MIKCPSINARQYTLLESRVGRCHLSQRLGLERDFEARVFGLGRNFFHIENWYSVHSCIRQILRMSFLLGRGRRSARTIQVRTHEIAIENLPAVFDGYTLLHITDLHLDMHPDLPTALIEAVRGLDYDICVITGDFRAKTYGPYQAAVDCMAKVRPHLHAPVFGVLGNHDTIRMVLGLEALDIRLLLNEWVPLEREGEVIYLAGIDDPHYFRADNLEKASAGIPQQAVSILLAHSPEIYRHAAYANFDVLLCGHTHGGQICLPGGIALMNNANCPRSLCAGPWRYQQLNGYTSAGSGVCVVDVRLNCPPEVTLQRLRCL